MQVIRLLPDISAAIPFQMALDEILYRDFLSEQSKGLRPAPVLRFYTTPETSVSVGYSFRESVTDTKNICRRMTGGGRVHHGQDLIFSFIAGKEHDESFSSVRISYWKIHEAMKEGFSILDISVRFYRVDEKLEKGPDCFIYPISTDLAIGNKKIAGGAQKRASSGFLHQESLQNIPGITAEILKGGMLKGFLKVFGTGVTPADIDPSVLDRAKTLSQTKYENQDYTRRGNQALSIGIENSPLRHGTNPSFGGSERGEGCVQEYNYTPRLLRHPPLSRGEYKQNWKK